MVCVLVINIFWAVYRITIAVSIADCTAWLSSEATEEQKVAQLKTSIQTWKHKWQDWFLSRLDPELSIKILFNKFKGFGQNNNPISSDVDHGMIWESIVTCIYPVQWFKDCRPLCHVHYMFAIVLQVSLCTCTQWIILYAGNIWLLTFLKTFGACETYDLIGNHLLAIHLSWYQQFGRSPQFHPFYYLRLQKIMNIVYTDDMSRLVQCPSSCFRE